jgi:hypothetical protein
MRAVLELGQQAFDGERDMKDMNKLMLALVIAALGLPVLAGATSVQAQEGGGASTTYDFDDDLVQGDLVRPDGENLMVRRRGARESLIKIREHFVPELLKSVENL